MPDKSKTLRSDGVRRNGPNPSEKKTAREMTTEELARRVFPPEVLEKAKEIAHQGDEKPPKKPRKKAKSS